MLRELLKSWIYRITPFLKIIQPKSTLGAFLTYTERETYTSTDEFHTQKFLEYNKEIISEHNSILPISVSVVESCNRTFL